MYDSMINNLDDFRIFTFCMDDDSYSAMSSKKLEYVIPVSYSDLEKFDKELSAVKPTRSKVEYYFTCTPAICNYILENHPEIDLLTYLDSDLYFFSDTEVIFEEIGNNSIAIVEHRFSKHGLKFLKLGRFNVAWITFRRDEQGLKCLRNYREKCLEWCFDYLDGDRYADQKYLDSWPDEFSGVAVIGNKGVNLACWNVGNYSIRKKNNQYFVDNDQLVFYHFAGFKQLKEGLYTSNISSYFIRPDSLIKNEIYGRYILKLQNNSLHADISKKTVNPKYQSFSVRRKLKDLFRSLRIALYNDYIKV